MLDFRRHTKAQPRNFLGQREQLRLLGLMLLAGFVLVAGRQIAKPLAWNWFFAGDAPREADQSAPRAERRAHLPAPLRQGEFLSPADPLALAQRGEPPAEQGSAESSASHAEHAADEAAPPQTTVAGDDPDQAADEPKRAAEQSADGTTAEADAAINPKAEIVAPDSKAEDSAAAASAGDRSATADVGPRYFPGVRADYLRTVRDDTFLEKRENDAWFHLLEILSKTDEAQLEQASIGNVSFVQLDDQPKQYRGQIVTLAGLACGVQPKRAPANSYGVSNYYQLALLPRGGPAEPIILYVLDLPAGFPTDASATAEVRVTGFFYKRWAYQAQDRPRSAPLVLAKTVVWEKPVPKAAQAAAGPVEVVGYIAAALALGSLLIGWIYWQSRQRSPSLRSAPAAVSPGMFAALKQADLAPTPDQVISQMGGPDRPKDAE